MAWIKIDQTLFSHRKTYRMAAQLDITRMEAVGHIAALWAWAIDNAPDGCLPCEDEMIAEGAYWFGNPERFLDALIYCGFVDDDGDGHRQLHDWEEWAGALIRKREADKERIRLQRARKAMSRE